MLSKYFKVCTLCIVGRHGTYLSTFASHRTVFVTRQDGADSRTLCGAEPPAASQDTLEQFASNIGVPMARRGATASRLVPTMGAPEKKKKKELRSAVLSPFFHPDWTKEADR